MGCTIYMGKFSPVSAFLFFLSISLSLSRVPLTDFPGAEDVRRQSLNVFRMKLLGAKVVAVDAGSRTLRDAVNECLRNWVKSLSTTHYIIG